ncbi:EAL domain-containing protein [Vibrio rotiferianus]|uniref:EAL domain-containing protein n=1 Tax=Vibrio rotiferianus TaxID=190895 RepID=UPI00117E2638|nr:EAL domain-containing protein [Vibrio rotiferianus]
MSLYSLKQGRSAFDNKLSIWHWLGIQILLFVAVQVSFSISSFFVVSKDSVQVLSFTAALVVSALIRYGWKVLPTLSMSLLFYYLVISGRPSNVALLFSSLLPCIPLVFAALYKRALISIEDSNYTLKLGYYVLILGLLYPVANTVILWSMSHIYIEHSPLSFDFFSYSILSGVLTHMTLTPLLSLGFSYILDGNKSPYLKLDLTMLRNQPSQQGYRIWLIICGMILLGAITSNNSLLINTLCLSLLCLVGVGLGKFGLIRPFLIASITLLICVENIVSQYNAGLIQQEHLYGMLLVLFVLSMLTFLLGAHTIKNFITARKAVEKERVDSFTGLYTLSQLQEDISPRNNVVLIYIDLKPTLSKLNGLGHQGQAQLMRQLSQYLAQNTEYLQRAYLPPFANGLICFAPRLPYINTELKKLIQLLDDFYFYFEDSSVSLVKRTIQCVDIAESDNVEALVSKLCQQRPQSNLAINWLDAASTSKSKLNKLSFIQSCFRENKFELYCQPYLALNTKNTGSYFEVLLRLNQDDSRVMSPAEFFPLIHEFGLEIELDEWVITNTFCKLSQNIVDWDNLGKCSINLTAKALNSPSLAHNIRLHADIYGVPLKKVCFEITESDALRNESIAIQNLSLLREAGCTIALDDFGTGYASFDYLRRLPLDVLKVDGSFVKDIVSSENDRIIVQAISQVANSMKLVTVAEFVESEAHIETLKSLNIQFAQGFGVAKPLPLQDYLKKLSNKA